MNEMIATVTQEEQFVEGCTGTISKLMRPDGSLAADSPRILIIYTGGTIGMTENPSTHCLEPYKFDYLIQNVPKLRRLFYNIDYFQFEEPLDSSAINPTHWDIMAKTIEENYGDYDGFVILHGTDTMAYTASALSFMLENLRKPVVITGSQLPIGEVRTDGEENLITALQVAAANDDKGAPMIQEVCILFENYLWRGNRATKISADNFNAFKSNNYPPLAQIGLGIHFNLDALYRTAERRPLHTHYAMDRRVMFIDLFPGITEQTLRHQLATPGIRGVVLKTFGAGNAPTAPWFAEAVREAIERGTVVVNVTQCINGAVHHRYAAADALMAAGAVAGHDITCEAAITKLMYLFGLGLDSAEVADHFACSICGELTAG